MDTAQTDLDRHQQIELAAYYLWEERGCPMGEPEVDWFQAEAQVTAHHHTVIETVAEVVGSVLGSVAGVAAAVGRFVQSAE